MLVKWKPTAMLIVLLLVIISLQYFSAFAALQSAEELERLTVDEQLQPIERAVYLLRYAVKLNK